LLFEQDAELFRDRLWPAALVCSVIANVNRDAEKRPEPFSAADFMPGAKTEEDEMREFVEAIQRGETFATDPDELEQFKRSMHAAFGNIATSAKPAN
jgi:hypothetical protein